ncbi:hypothetical protein Nepgr_005270 [Nepenthes gracilis]|uniref:Uncharacterized protein n=1 Tax=Nepenthes gracilis TaxID=150966 RepID=A0AAD3S316_NEPGR|nr:hypothetical protein Nepgr_005270 [Nepenthes gracilis]
MVLYLVGWVDFVLNVAPTKSPDALWPVWSNRWSSVSGCRLIVLGESLRRMAADGAVFAVVRDAMPMPARSAERQLIV